VAAAYYIPGSLRQRTLLGTIHCPEMGSDAAAAGNVIGYDVARMTFQFTMLTPDAMTVGCTSVAPH
jgi:hypothetical protein